MAVTHYKKCHSLSDWAVPGGKKPGFQRVLVLYNEHDFVLSSL